MKIKRYFAPDMRQAIRKVREEQGPDAVILSNRRVNGGIEIIAALDYDDSLFDDLAPPSQSATQHSESEPAAATNQSRSSVEAEAVEIPKPRAERPRPTADVEWAQDPTLVAMQQEIRTLRGILENQLSQFALADLARRNPAHAGLLQRLSDMGIGTELAQALASEVTETADLDQAWRHGLGLLSHRIRVTDDDILGRGGVVSVVGPTGVGKTTMVAKLAARYALRHGKRHVALISTDNFRIGAYEQLHTYGQLLGVPVYSATSNEELNRLLADLADKHLVLIDTAGMSQRDMRLAEQMETLASERRHIRTYLVLSANIQLATLTETVNAFRRIQLAGCLITKIDEAASLGGVLTAIVRSALPVAYVGDGQRVPEDLHPARAHALVSRAVALMQQSTGRSAGDENRNTANAHV